MKINRLGIAMFFSALCTAAFFLFGCRGSTGKQPPSVGKTTSDFWVSNYVAKSANPNGDDVPLALVNYSDMEGLGLVLETLDRNGIEYVLYSHHGRGVLVRPRDLERAKALLRGDVRLKGREISIAR